MHTGLERHEQLMTEFSFFLGNYPFYVFLTANVDVSTLRHTMQREFCLDKLLCVFQWSVALQWICSLFHIWPLLFSRLKKKRIYIYWERKRDLQSAFGRKKTSYDCLLFSFSPYLSVCLSLSIFLFLSFSLCPSGSLSLFAYVSTSVRH